MPVQLTSDTVWEYYDQAMFAWRDSSVHDWCSRLGVTTVHDAMMVITNPSSALCLHRYHQATSSYLVTIPSAPLPEPKAPNVLRPNDYVPVRLLVTGLLIVAPPIILLLRSISFLSFSPSKTFVFKLVMAR